jgi:hypothetical protein
MRRSIAFLRPIANDGRIEHHVHARARFRTERVARREAGEELALLDAGGAVRALVEQGQRVRAGLDVEPLEQDPVGQEQQRGRECDAGIVTSKSTGFFQRATKMKLIGPITTANTTSRKAKTR